jgi:hypothetical protein
MNSSNWLVRAGIFRNGMALLTIFFFNVVTIAQTPAVDSLLIADSNMVSGQSADTIVPASPDTTYHNLRDDDPEFNRKYPLWIPAVRVVMSDAFNWALARYMFNYEWARISTETWKKNLKGPWVWDKDRFGVNFIGHPHSGNLYFNVARANGYSFWESFPFAVGGSLVWELFGENEPPSKNDIINTPISGMFLGEVLYRISSNILDDRARGGNRVFREILAGIVNPPRALNRLTQGKMFRVTNKEVYQKEPLNITLNAGVHKVNEDNHFGTGSTNFIINLQFDYGDPFEVRRRKPFDVFRFRAESRFGNDRRLIDNVIGYGILFGKNLSNDRSGSLLGIFQHFDYWNNKIFELGSLGFGPGMISRINIGTNSKLYSGVFASVVPLAGNASRFGPDTSEFRDYSYGGGWQARVEETFHINKWLSMGFTGYYYWLNAYEGLRIKSRIGIIKPRVIVSLFKNTSLGLEHHIYTDNRATNNIPDLHLTRTEQKFFIQINFDDPARKGRYR